jgi:hypothetical protein
MNKDWKLAKKLMQDKSAQEVFSSMDLDIYNEELVLSPASGVEKIKEVKKRAQSLLDKSFSSDRVYSLKRVVSLIGILESSM